MLSMYVEVTCRQRSSIAYIINQAAIIPKEELFSGIDVGARFFQLTIGNVIKNDNHTLRFYSGLKAVSAIGNIIVVTFTAARGMRNLQILSK
jgi:hypothetical protein